MATGVKLKYGPMMPYDMGVFITGYMGASEVIKNQSGRFVKVDASGYLEIAGDTDGELVGWVEAAEQTCSSTEGGTKVSFIPIAACIGKIFRMPINSGQTYDISMRYKTCDLEVDGSDIQTVQLDASAEDTLIIVNGSSTDWVDVMVNPVKVGATGVV